MSVIIREKDKLDDVKILEITENWNVNEEIDIILEQKLFLHLLLKIEELEARITKLESK